jgi:hypothetical protein
MRKQSHFQGANRYRAVADIPRPRQSTSFNGQDGGAQGEGGKAITVAVAA